MEAIKFFDYIISLYYYWNIFLLSLSPAVRADRMRGGRNKFGPMYKRDRALKQQAIRQRQQMLSSCQMHMANGMNSLPTTVEDIKPSTLLMGSNQLTYTMGSGGGGGGGNSSPLSSPAPSLPSPVYDSSPPVSQLTMSNSECPPVNSGGNGVMQGTLQQYPTMVNALHPLHTTLLGQQPVLPPNVPSLISDFKATMPNETERKQKLLNFIQTEFGGFQCAWHPDKLFAMICRLVDQCLFLMVEWARNSFFFKELKVSRIIIIFIIFLFSSIFSLLTSFLITRVVEKGKPFLLWQHINSDFCMGLTCLEINGLELFEWSVLYIKSMYLPNPSATRLIFKLSKVGLNSVFSFS